MKTAQASLSSTLASLGKFELRIGDRVVPPVPTQKARALLAYLVANRGRDVGRERLMELFWDEAEPERAREGLRTALSSIRHALREVHGDPDALLFADKSVVRWIAATDYDADRFVTLANSDDVAEQREALALYGGDFLEGNYDEWASNERERIAGAYETSLANVLRHTRDPSIARRLLERNPYDETAYAVLIESEARAHRPAAAKELLEKYRTAMAELGAEPSAQLEQRLLAAADEPVAPESNVPTPLSSFIGRADEIAQVKGLLQRSRLLSVVGAGGIGKTRIALAVAADVAQTFDDGVRFVDLAAIADRRYIDSTIATAVLGTLPTSLERAPQELLISAIQHRHMLLIFDNCEHLMPAIVSAVETILQRCPRVAILATSREPLRAEGEDVVRLPALPESDAIALFAERARACDKRFELNERTESDVAHICRRLDGIPLAIELAAPRVNVLSVKQLRAKLEEQFRILTSATTTALPRHKTVRALVDWSHELLTPPEQRLLRTCGVFVGGFTLEGATALFGEDASDAGVLDLLSSLVAKSLVLVESGPEVDRYRLLQATQEYAVDKLRECNEYAVVRERHLKHFLQFACEGDTGYGTSNAREWLQRYPPEFENIRAAIDFSFEMNESGFAAALVGLAREFYQELGLHAEGIHRAERALEALPAESPLELRAMLWLAIAQLGNTLYQTPQALANARRAHEAFEQLDDTYHLAFASQTLGFALMRSHERKEAEAYFVRAQRLAEELGNRRVILRILLRRAENQRYLLPPSEWLPLYERALELAQVLDDELYVGYVLGHMAEMHFALGDPARAIVRAHAAHRIFEVRKDTAKRSNALANLAAYHIAVGDLASARRFAQGAIVLGRESESMVNAINGALHLGAIAALEGNGAVGARLIGFAYGAHVRHGGSPEYTEDYVRDKAREALRERLGEDEMAALEADGAALSDDEGFALALHVAAPPAAATQR